EARPDEEGAPGVIRGVEGILSPGPGWTWGRRNVSRANRMTTIPAARIPVQDITALAVSLALCFAVAGLGGYWTSLGLGPWYDGLHKPPWTPPNGIFGPVWTLLYISMAVAAWLVWRERRQSGVGLSLSLFALQLSLNLAWTGIFFALRRPGPAF